MARSSTLFFFSALLAAAVTAAACSSDPGGEEDSGLPPPRLDSGRDVGVFLDADTLVDAPPAVDGDKPLIDAGPDAPADAILDVAKPDGTVDGGTSNGTCATAVTLTSGVPVTGSTQGTGNDYDMGVTPSAACAAGFPFMGITYDGPEATYKISVPAGKKLTVTATPTTNWDVALGFVTNCAMAGPSCVAATDKGYGGQPETLVWTNSGQAAVTVYVLVDSYIPSQYGPFVVLATIQ
jgi:hypothetical protein